MAPAHLRLRLRDGERVAVPPVAGGVEPETLAPVTLDDVRGARGRALRVRIERHPRPESAVEDEPHGVLLDVIDEHAPRIGALVLQRVENEPRSLQLVLEVR